MARITRDQFDEIYSQTPAGTSEDDLAQALQSRGHQVDYTPTSVGQAGQQAFAENTPQREDGILSPFKAIAGGVGNVLDTVGRGVDFVSGKKMPTIAQTGNQVVNTLGRAQGAISDVAQNAVQTHANNTSYTSAFTNPGAYFTEDIPAALGGLVQGANRVVGGMTQGIGQGLEGIGKTFGKEDTTKYTIGSLQGFTDAINGGLLLMSANAPLLPDFIEKGLGDTFSLPTQAGGGIGSAVGNTMGYNEKSNDPNKRAMGHLLSTTGEAAGSLATVEAARMGVNKIKQRSEHPEGTPAGFRPEVQQAATNLGVDAPAIMYRNNPALNFMYNLSAKGFFGTKLVSEVNAFKTGLESSLKSMKESITPATSQIEVGNIMVDSFQKYQSAIEKQKATLYDKVAEQTADIPAATDATMKMLEDLRQRTGPEGTAMPSQIYELVNGLYSSIEKGISFSKLRNTHSDLGAKIGTAFSDPAVKANMGMLKRLYGEMSKDLDATASAISPDIGKMLKTANDLHSQFKKNLQSYFGKTVEDVGDITKLVNPENVIDKFIKEKSYSHLTDLTGILGETGTAAMKGGFLYKMFEYAKNGDTLSPAKVATFVGKYENAARALFTDGEFYKLKNAETLGEAYKPLQKIAEGSQTAYIANNAGVFGSALPAVGMAMVGNVAPLAGLVGYVVGSKASQVFFTSNFGKALMKNEFHPVQ